MLMDLLYIISNQTQGIRNLCDIPDLKIPTDTKKQIENNITEIYSDYKAFMESPDMPDYNLYIKSQHGLELASTMYRKDQGHNLYISDSLLKEPSMKERLFHEFTHIYDSEYLDKEYAYRKYSIRDRTKTHVYTEVHAEQIRFLFMLGCKTVNDTPKNIDHNTEIFDLKGERVTFYKYLNNFKAALEKYYVDKMKTCYSVSKDLIGDIADKISYYIGAFTIYQRYCTYKIDDLIDLSVIADYWNIDIPKIIAFYCEHDLQNSNWKTLKKYDIYQIGNILMLDLMNSAREKFKIIDDNN